MTGFEHAAVAEDDLKKFELSTIRDRVTEANIVLPSSPDEAIKRMYCLNLDPKILIGIRPGSRTHLEPGPYGGQLLNIYDDAIPLNDAAVAYFGSRGNQRVDEADLTPVTLNIVLGKKKLGLLQLQGAP